VRGEFGDMPPQWVVEGIGSVKLTRVNQTHEQIAGPCAVQLLIEERIPAIQNGLL
jgi:hypothetical protein